MKNVKQFLFLALLSGSLFSCSDNNMEDQATPSPSPKSAESTMGHGNLLYKIKNKGGIMYIGNAYNHSFNANVISSAATSIGDDITISSPANENIKIENAVRNNGNVTFDLTAYNSNNQNISALTSVTMDETGFDNLVTRNCTECADAMLIAMVNLLTHNDSDNTVQKAVSASQDCEGNGGTPELSLEYGFFNNTSVFNCN